MKLEVACNKLTNIVGKACNNILEKLAIYQSAWVILVKLGEINMIPLIILSKTLKVLSQGKVLPNSSSSTCIW
jgi:hypothetical protein